MGFFAGLNGESFDNVKPSASVDLEFRIAFALSYARGMEVRHALASL
jgi:hypothetical protein